MKLTSVELTDGTRVDIPLMPLLRSGVRWEIRDETHPTAALTGKTVQNLYVIDDSKPGHEFPVGRVTRATWEYA